MLVINLYYIPFDDLTITNGLVFLMYFFKIYQTAMSGRQYMKSSFPFWRLGGGDHAISNPRAFMDNIYICLYKFSECQSYVFVLKNI